MIKMRSYWIRVCPKSNESVLTGNTKDTQEQREEGDMNIEAGIGVM